MREQGQHPGVMGAARAVGADLADDQLGEAGFELQADGLGRPVHRLAQFGAGQRAEDHVPVLEGVGEFGVAEALFVEVGPYAEDDEGGAGPAVLVGGGRGVQELDEGVPVALLGAEGEGLLELVDDDDRAATGGRGPPGPGGDGRAHGPGEAPGARPLPGRPGEFGDPPGQLGDRIGTGDQLEHLPPGVQGAVPYGGHQTGVEQGGLPGARGADQHQQSAGALRGP